MNEHAARDVGDATDRNERFLRMLFGDDWEGATVVSIPVLNQDAWTAYRAGSGVLKHFRPTANNYFDVSLFNDPLLRRKENFTALCVLAVDDVGPKVDPVKLEAALGRPTYRIGTSPGNEQWGYRLEPRVTDLARATRLIRRVVVALAGGKDPGMKGVTRVMRLPEGTNTKKHLGPRGWACVARLSPWEKLDPTVVEHAFPLAEDKISSGGTPGAAAPGDPDGLTSPGLPAVLDPGPGSGPFTVTDPVARGLWRLGRIKSSSRTLAGGVGWDVICPWVEDHTPTGAVDTGTVYFRGGGFKCWHGHCDGRGPAEVRARVDELLRADSGGLVGLQDLEPASGRLDAVDPSRVPPSPVQAKVESDAAKQFWANTVFHAQEDRFIDLRTGSALTERAFNAVWGRHLDGGDLPLNARGRPITPGAWYHDDPRQRVVDARTWWPGRGILFTDTLDGGRPQRFINTWVDLERPLASVLQADLDRHIRTSPWAELLRVLFDPDTLRRWLNYAAMIVGAVEIKPGNNPLIMGPQGAGKEIIIAPLIQVLGPARHQMIDQEALNGGFTDWVKHRLITLPEVRRTTRGTTTDHDQYQRIKALCDPGKPLVRLNEKYRLPIAVRNVFVLVMTSNEDRPITLPADDRRIWVIRVQHPAGWDAAKFQALARWYEQPSPWSPVIQAGETNAHAIVEWLIRRWDLNTMLGQVAGAAPLSQDKQRLITIGHGDVQVWVEELLGRTTPDPLTLPDVFTASDVMARIEDASRTGGEGLPRGVQAPAVRVIGRMLGDLGCVALNGQQCVTMPKGPMRHVWSKPGDQTFIVMSERELAAWLAANRRA